MDDASCLSDEAVEAFVNRTLAPAAREQVVDHLAGCADCSAMVAEMARFVFRDEASAPAAPGATVSRYEIIQPVGQGGGGVVYEAYDPQLKRKVALKVVRTDIFPGLAPADAEARLLREAETMARLSHPNVVAVHDAGSLHNDVFIVMDFVEGDTLRTWLARRGRGWREIVDVFLAAGRGLAAAHAAGLVHRDFKPDNVLIGEGGRVQVSDFGLARPTASEPEGHASLAPRGAGPITTLAGTPGFMAPEQRAGEAADARSDQYSFCLSLFRALERAGGGTGQAPAEVNRALLRGLSTAPEDRFASMDELLAALAPPLVPARRGRVLALAAAAAGLATVATFAVLQGRGPRTGVRSCGDGKVRSVVEECDDGNRDDADGCTTGCLACRPDERTFFWAPSGHCYTLHEPASWADAQATCTREGGYLGVFVAANEATAIEQRFLRGTGRRVWIGLRRPTSSGSFTWLTGETSPAYLDAWWQHMSERRSGEDCVYEEQQVRQNNWGFVFEWPTAPCEEKLSFVCERQPWSEDARSRRAYRTFYEPVPWNVARERCSGAGGHLATPADKEQNDFLVGQVKVETWLGARGRGRGRGRGNRTDFGWVTGAPVDFRAFAPGEPDASSSPACVVLGVDDLWHDRSCQNANPYTCQMD